MAVPIHETRNVIELRTSALSLLQQGVHQVLAHEQLFCIY
jgi:hypothetical protein